MVQETYELKHVIDFELSPKLCLWYEMWTYGNRTDKRKDWERNTVDGGRR